MLYEAGANWKEYANKFSGPEPAIAGRRCKWTLDLRRTVCPQWVDLRPSVIKPLAFRLDGRRPATGRRSAPPPKLPETGSRRASLNDAESGRALRTGGRCFGTQLRAYWHIVPGAAIISQVICYVRDMPSTIQAQFAWFPLANARHGKTSARYRRPANGPQRLSMAAFAAVTVANRSVTPESAFTPTCSVP